MNDSQLLLRLAEANAYLDDAPLPEGIWAPDLALQEIERRIGMSHQTNEQERTTTFKAGDPGRSEALTPRRRPSVPARAWLASAVVIVVIGATALFINREEQGLIAGQPPGPLDAYVAALQANDAEAAVAVLSSDVLPGFTPWLVGSDTSGIGVTNCRVTDVEIGRVVCDVDMGPDFFYTLIGGNRETELYANVGDTHIDLIDIPNPDRNVAGVRFRRWVEEFHIDRYAEMFDSSASTMELTRWTEEAAETQFEFLDEYLAYLASQG